MKMYQSIARTVDAYHTCRKWAASRPDSAKMHEDMAAQHELTLSNLVHATAPSGSGIDSGTQFDIEASSGEKLVFTCGYHHMCDCGYYDGWTEHKITVKPSLSFGFTLNISGSNRDDIKDYLHEVYYAWLNQETAN